MVRLYSGSFRAKDCVFQAHGTSSGRLLAIYSQSPPNQVTMISSTMQGTGTNDVDNPSVQWVSLNTTMVGVDFSHSVSPAGCAETCGGASVCTPITGGITVGGSPSSGTHSWQVQGLQQCLFENCSAGKYGDWVDGVAAQASCKDCVAGQFQDQAGETECKGTA